MLYIRRLVVQAGREAARQARFTSRQIPGAHQGRTGAPVAEPDKHRKAAQRLRLLALPRRRLPQSFAVSRTTDSWSWSSSWGIDARYAANSHKTVAGAAGPQGSSRPTPMDAAAGVKPVSFCAKVTCARWCARRDSNSHCHGPKPCASAVGLRARGRHLMTQVMRARSRRSLGNVAGALASRRLLRIVRSSVIFPSGLWRSTDGPGHRQHCHAA